MDATAKAVSASTAKMGDVTVLCRRRDHAAEAVQPKPRPRLTVSPKVLVRRACARLRSSPGRADRCADRLARGRLRAYHRARHHGCQKHACPVSPRFARCDGDLGCFGRCRRATHSNVRSMQATRSRRFSRAMRKRSSRSGPPTFDADRDRQLGRRWKTSAVPAEDPNLSSWVEDKVAAASDRPELTSAGIVVSGGRGVGSEDRLRPDREARRQARRRRGSKPRRGRLGLCAQRLASRARPAKSWHRTFTWPSASRARSSTWQG